ncbi:hypothetical protein [Magnetovibrio blakemorei]|uniref:MobA/MobL protein domain-containing protein n=1 Tax=Magnetovibrio blakemorei TaxID=28181 RepID=A0A1E5Q6L8_9PROT|nr:hypothetical protein [Magnetovibrio blakemorei]OEJ66581.1 hypothetical protein BEN30_12030 [Magnetovibrio blakemorei]
MMSKQTRVYKNQRIRRLFDDDEKVRMGRLVDDGFDRLISGRWGPTGVRTFHVDFRSTKGLGSSPPAIDYAIGEGEYANRDDLEFITEENDLVRTVAEKIEVTARIKNGPTAERSLLKHVVELPANFEAEQRAESLEKMVDYWLQKGHPAGGAVHYPHGGQPHVHLIIAARPIVLKEDGSFEIDRSPERRPLVGKAGVQAERKAVAKIINEVNGGEIFHHGKLADTGIKRKPKKRVSIRAYKAGQFERDLEIVADQYQEHERAREEARIKREEKCRLKRLRALKKAEQLRNEGFTVLTKTEARHRDAIAKKKLDRAQRGAARLVDDESATAKQISFLVDLAQKTAQRKVLNKIIDEMGDNILTKGWVGKTIRLLQENRENEIRHPGRQNPINFD